MATHTPGPWRVREYHDGEHFIDADEAGTVATAHATGVGSGDSLSNAHLIAAAPDLLAALRNLVEREGWNAETRSAARAAIAKAEGKEG